MDIMKRHVYLDFEEDDPIWDIIKRYELTSDDVKQAILAWAYTFAKADEKDDVSIALNNGFKLFRRKMMNVDKEELKRIYEIT